MSVMSEHEWKRSTDAAGRLIPKHAVLRFKTGDLAFYREDTLAWSITGSGRAWGDAGEMLRAYGDYEIV